MAADVDTTMRSCEKSARNLVRLKSKTNPMLLFTTKIPLELIALDLLGTLNRTKKGLQYVLIIF